MICIQAPLVPPLEFETVRGWGDTLQLGRIGREGSGGHSDRGTEGTHTDAVHSLYSYPGNDKTSCINGIKLLLNSSIKLYTRSTETLRVPLCLFALKKKDYRQAKNY